MLPSFELPGAVLGFIGMHLALRTEAQGIETAIANGDLATAERRARLLGRVVLHHHAAEDERALPVWLATFTPEEHAAFERSLQRHTPVRDVGLLVSWLIDSSPEAALDVAAVKIPAPFRLLHQLWWRRRYERNWGTVRWAA